jgi:hypothetical protein
MAARALHRMQTATIVETLDAANAAIFAAAKSDGAGSACAAMNNDMVKPMPANAPAVASWRHEYSSGLVAQFSRTASAHAGTRPTGLPMTRPHMMASGRGTWVLSTFVLSRTPAFASANSDSTKLARSRRHLTQHAVNNCTASELADHGFLT